MKRLIITSMIALIALAGPTAAQLRADDAHHPENAANAKTSAKEAGRDAVRSAGAKGLKRRGVRPAARR